MASGVQNWRFVYKYAVFNSQTSISPYKLASRITTQLVQKVEYKYALNPIKIHQFPYHKNEFEDLNFEFIDGDTEIAEGLKLILTPGHTPGSQTLLVDTDDGVYALVADLVNTRECWESDPKLANGYHTDLIVHYQSFDKVAAMADHILEGHEFKVFEHECYPYK